MTAGWVCLGLSVISGGWGWLSYNAAMSDQALASSSDYFAEKVADGLSTAATANSASWLFFAMFLVFWSVGYIVQAIHRLAQLERK